MTLTAEVDADQADDTSTIISTSGMVRQVVHVCIAWKFRMEVTGALFTFEAEYREMTEACKNIY